MVIVCEGNAGEELSCVCFRVLEGRTAVVAFMAVSVMGALYTPCL